MTGKKNYWLFKTEPTSFSIEDLARCPNKTTCWDGVRNYQARNLLRDSIKLGDEVLIYHSNAEPPAVVGLAEIVKEGYIDHTAFDKKDHHYDPKSKPDNPAWYMVDVKYRETFKKPVALPSLKDDQRFENMVLLQRSRLSIQPVTKNEFEAILKLAGVN